jgi:hypothetical protein
MTLRRMLLGLVGLVAMCGAATAKPPGGALSEGREVDPVVRDFQLPESPPVPESGGAAPGNGKPGDFFGASMLDALGEAIQNRLAIYLGPIRSNVR